MTDTENREGTDIGPNSRSLNDTVAQSGPGIPDDAASEGYDPIADAQVEHDLEAGVINPDTVFRKG